MGDLISRQAAIEALARTAREKFNLSDEFNHYLAGLMDGENAIRQLPSAQPEVIRCKDCKWYEGNIIDTSFGVCCHPDWVYDNCGFGVPENGWCYRGERKNDEADRR